MRYFGLLAFLWVFLSSCTAPGAGAERMALMYKEATTERLWQIHRTSLDTNQLLFVEAELGTRGAYRSGSSYIGQRTSSTVDVARYRRAHGTRSRDFKDCGDFSTEAEAQAFFLAAGGPYSDPHNLDGDGDGNACEWGARIKRNSRSASRATRSSRVSRPTAPRRTYRAPRRSSRCFVGPRGSTYTLTASGRRNYGGC